jgi:very-short-patch-repair endonuclease
VVRFWDDEVLRNTVAVLDEIARQVMRRQPEPSP